MFFFCSCDLGEFLVCHGGSLIFQGLRQMVSQFFPFEAYLGDPLEDFGSSSPGSKVKPENPEILTTFGTNQHGDIKPRKSKDYGLQPTNFFGMYLGYKTDITNTMIFLSVSENCVIPPHFHISVAFSWG